MASPYALVSIIIPTYNHAHFLGEAIESALSQPGAPIEVIVVDDGSTDDPASVVSRYPGVRLIRQENAGLAAARNAGWRAAVGRYLVFLDADDRLVPGAVPSNLDFFARHPTCGFVYGRYRFIGPDGMVRNDASFVGIGPDPFASFLAMNTIGMHATVMYRREAVEEAGGFDPTLRACEDYDLYLRLSRLHPVASRPELIAEYRIHGANMSRDVPFMLTWALATLRRQKPAALGNPAHRRAYRAGIRAWKRLYAEQQLRRTWTRPSPRSILALLKIARAAPEQVLTGAAKSLLRIQRRLRAAP